ncbi:hypothetical protein OHV90_11795, partial [Acinetobacter baumannii]|nr:hypothetical protein [Acinetobacter baumannii]
MVKQYKRMFRPKFAIAALCIAIANISLSYADGFYTIIGPDGRPMIVPSKKVETRNSNSKLEITKPVIESRSVNTPIQEIPQGNIQNSKGNKKVEQEATKILNTA